MALELVAGEKKSGESSKAIQAANDYCRMGAGRSLSGLLSQYREMPEKSAPTVSINTLQKWSQRFDWQERAEQYDAAIEAEKQAAEKERQREIAERRKAIMEEGAALDFERVERLKRFADFLEEQIFYQPTVDEHAANLIGIAGLMENAEGKGNKEELSEIADLILTKLDPNDPKHRYPHVWARNVKALAGGRSVETFTFNSALFAEWRSILDDIAKETGGRRQRTVTESIDYSKLTDEQLQRVAAGEDPIQVILSDYSSGTS